MLVNDALEVGWQAVVLGLVHGKHKTCREHRGATGFDLGVELADFLQLERGDDFPSGQEAVDRSLGHGVSHPGDRHTHWGRAQFGEQFGGLAAGGPDLQALEVVEIAHRLARGADKALVVHPGGQNLGARELLGGVFAVVVPGCSRGHFGGVGHERELQRLHDRESPRGITRQRHDQVVHPVFHSVHQLPGGAAARHRGQKLTTHAVVAFFGDILAPGHRHPGVPHGHSGPNVVQLEHHLLRLRADGEHAAKGQGQAATLNLPNEVHVRSPLILVKHTEHKTNLGSRLSQKYEHPVYTLMPEIDTLDPNARVSTNFWYT